MSDIVSMMWCFGMVYAIHEMSCAFHLCVEKLDDGFKRVEQMQQDRIKAKLEATTLITKGIGDMVRFVIKFRSARDLYAERPRARSPRRTGSPPRARETTSMPRATTGSETAEPRSTPNPGIPTTDPVPDTTQGPRSARQSEQAEPAFMRQRNVAKQPGLGFHAERLRQEIEETVREAAERDA
jgi:hypothetical protein